ncbi:MAG: 50S ribosomal protein L15 [Rhodospirillaceae bacterium]
MKLNQIAETRGSRKPRKRVGRGPSSGLGKTAGKGQKGQKSRSGVALAGFEGGQMPLYRRLPKRGFTNIFRKRYREINLNRVQSAIEAGKIDVSKPIDLSVMQSAGLLKTPRDGVRLLARGTLNSKVTIEVSGASKSAIDAVEKAGGKVVITSPTSTRAGNEA